MADDGGRIKLKREDDSAIEFNNTSMTDVIFILLIFFVSLSQVRTSQLQVDLPSVSSKAESGIDDAKPVVIELGVDDVVLLDGRKVTPEEIGAVLAARRGADGSEPKIRIRGDAASKHGTMMRVVGALADAGLTKIEFAVKTGATVH